MKKYWIYNGGAAGTFFFFTMDREQETIMHELECIQVTREQAVNESIGNIAYEALFSNTDIDELEISDDAKTELLI